MSVRSILNTDETSTDYGKISSNYLPAEHNYNPIVNGILTVQNPTVDDQAIILDPTQPNLLQINFSKGGGVDTVINGGSQPLPCQINMSATGQMFLTSEAIMQLTSSTNNITLSATVGNINLSSVAGAIDVVSSTELNLNSNLIKISPNNATLGNILVFNVAQTSLTNAGGLPSPPADSWPVHVCLPTNELFIVKP